MMSMKHYFSFIFCFSFVSSFVVAAPVGSSDDPLAKFVEFLKGNNCSMPTAVVLPFSGTDTSAFGYLSTPLKECRSSESVQVSSEPNLLCRETFDVLQNITCNDFSGLPKIDGSHLSSNVCKDFAEVQDILPKHSDYLSGRLADGVVCRVMCTGRYELLCKTLLWSYDIQAAIKKATNSKPKETLTENKNPITNESDPSVKTSEETGEEDPKEANEIADETKDTQPDKTYSEEPTKEVSPQSPAHDPIPQTVSLPNISKANTSQATQKSTSEAPDKNVPEAENVPKVENVPKEKNIPKEENVPKEEKSGEDVKEVSSATPEKVSTAEKVDNESRGSNTSSVVNESNAKSSTTDMKPEENPETEIESGGLQEPSENEKKTSLVMSSTDKMDDMEPHPDVKDPELYNDENDGDYPKQEYDNVFSPSLKKEPAVEEVSNPISSNSVVRETFLPGRNYLPEPEDSHFFFYFLSIVLILMAGYLVFHNKQKIIALIVEGRHERRRRSHGAGYKKLETK